MGSDSIDFYYGSIESDPIDSQVEPTCVDEFEKDYGTAESWALLFRRYKGYVEHSC